MFAYGSIVGFGFCIKMTSVCSQNLSVTLLNNKVIRIESLFVSILIIITIILNLRMKCKIKITVIIL